jgi:carbamoyltransferase
LTNKYILGLHIGHNSSCAIMRENEILYVGQEERFTNYKYFVGFPHLSLKYGLKKLKINPKDISNVAIAGKNFDPIWHKSNYVTKLSIREFFDYYGKEYWGKKLLGQNCDQYKNWIFKNKRFKAINKNFNYNFITSKLILNDKKRIMKYKEEIIKHIKEKINIMNSTISFFDHHTCHAYYAYFASPFRNKECAIVVIDSEGDGYNQTTWVAKKDKIINLAKSSESDIAHIYKMATLILGMRPELHEYKVMGLAPYAKQKYFMESYEPLKKISKIKDLKIVFDKRPKDLFTYLSKSWKGHRFDNICAAVQFFTEKLSKDLLDNIYKKTKIKRYVVSGGVSLNIKMNKKISELPYVKDFFVAGSGSDESLSIGACYMANKNYKHNKHLKNLYLGYNIDDDLSQKNIMMLAKKYKVYKKVSSKKIAKLLKDGEIIARISGKSEFGARALGNRSILANPYVDGVVEKINRAIKNRDFWMPFALSILKEKQKFCIINKKKLSSPFMTIGFNANKKNFEYLKNGCHKHDFTVRPQIVDKINCPDFHKLINEFYKLTNVPALLNTSFNLHGNPVVHDLKDAIKTFDNCELKFLLINDFLIKK